MLRLPPIFSKLHPVNLDMLQSAAVGVLALLVGMMLTRKFSFLRRFCVPTPVSGGILFSLLTLAVYEIWDMEISFDTTLRDVFMVLFFTSVGFQSDLTAIRKGGRPLAVMVILVAALIVIQNAAAVGIALGMGESPLLGMACGSIPMTGGHGTAGGFSPVLEQMGLISAPAVTMAAATFGLVAGSLLGGPLAERLVRVNRLSDRTAKPADVMLSLEGKEGSEEFREEHRTTDERQFRSYAKATYELFIAAGIGTVVGRLLSMTGIVFPTYFGALITAALWRNLTAVDKRMPRLDVDQIVSLGSIALSLFLGMAMVSLKLWQLGMIAVPMLVILIVQVALMALTAYFVAFPLLGRNYDAAVLAGGFCGFGLGATPNAMANMSAVCLKYRYSPVPFIVIPIVGAMFSDLINTMVISLFLNLV